MTITCEINGTEYNAADNYSIKEQAGATSTSSIDVLVAAGQSVPLSLSAVTVKKDGTAFFYGYIKSIESPEYSSGQEVKRYRLTVSSGNSVFKNRLVSEAYEDSYTHEIVADLFTKYIAAEGFTLGTISTTTQEYSSYNCSYSVLSDILDELADDCNASYYVDQNKVFNFITRDEFVQIEAPENLTGLKLEEDSANLRTVQVVTGASDETSTQTEGTYWAASQSNLTLGYQVSTVIGMTIAGTSVGVGLLGVDDDDITKTFLYKFGSQIITLNPNATTKPTTGQNVVCVYKGFYDVIVINTNEALLTSISNLNGTSGRIESIFTDETIDNNEDASNKANALLGQYDERTQVVSCSCHCLDQSALYTMWVLDKPELNIYGQFVITERSITSFGPDSFWIKVTLKNKGYFARYATVLKRDVKKKNTTVKVYKQSSFTESARAIDSYSVDDQGVIAYPVTIGSSEMFDGLCVEAYPVWG